MQINLKKSAFQKYQQKHNLGESKCAKKMNISPSQLWKVKEGIHSPGVSFIAGALEVFPEASFDDLFFFNSNVATTQHRWENIS